ncbi:hypothetical protein [Asticcacaulis sp. 201]|uniref:hypothetical protein n=1 Tax=Asticcacaulis sp. 201 TaxID=3028787 RepID=UPI002916FB09|nr:hypothetical protein [Asticcacaulis sp. 201]MDV6330033.1 hypothetical protein [Asticcacaulis sp. 201]
MKKSYGVWASWLNIASSFAAFGIGMIIIGKGGSGADAAVVGAPLLTGSEMLKLVIGLCLITQAAALAKLSGGRGARAVGFIAGLAMFVAGALGLAAVWLPAFHRAGSAVNMIALCGVAATGLWAALSGLAGFRDTHLPTWLCILGVLFAIPSLAAPFMPPMALGAFIIGIIWNFGVGICLSRAG